ncbi:MAG: PAS domain-containing sensor histidine kinase [Xanthomonadales bacterium]|nr:PAS domain-containing sensor histidine kinase [Xanthomonadales bacterium]
MPELLLPWILSLIGLIGGVLLLVANEARRHCVTLLSISYLLYVPSAIVPTLGFPNDGALLSIAAINNSLALCSAAFLVAAVRALANRVAWPAALRWLLASSLVINLLFAWIHPDTGWRLLAFNTVFLGMRIAAILLILDVYWRSGSIYALVWPVFLGVETLMVLLRALTAAVGNPLGFSMAAGHLLYWSWGPSLAVALLHAPLFILILMQRDTLEQCRLLAQLRTRDPGLPEVRFELDMQQRLSNIQGPVDAAHALLPVPIGTRLHDLPASPLTEQLRKVVDGAAEGTRAIHAQNIHGIERVFELSAVYRHDLRGAMHGYLVSFRDITEQQRLAGQLRFRDDLFDHLFQRAPVGMLLCLLEENIVLQFNPAFEQLTGRSGTELNGAVISSLVQQRDLRHLIQMQRELLRDGRSTAHELDLLTVQGAARRVRVQAVLVPGPNGQRMSWALIEDISEQRRVERLQSNFLGMVSHELRTPLAAIAGALDLIAHPSVQAHSKPARRLVEIARENTGRLQRKISELLDFNRLLDPNCVLNLEAQALAPALQTAVTTAAGAARVQVQLIDTAAGSTAMIDRVWLLRAVQHLLDNAVRHSPEHGTVTLQLSRREHALRIDVLDEGPGVAESLRPSLFDKFSQGSEGTTRLPGGHGLGLALVREVAVRHHGTAAYLPRPRGGANFYIELPLIDPDQAA